MKVRTEARREAIIDAAASVFLEMGYERASMNEVTKRMGGSKATIYSYFPSKEELFIAVVNRVATAHLAEAVSELAISVDKDTDAELDLRTLFTRFGERMLMVLINDESALAVYRMVVAESGHSDIGTMFYDSGPREFLQTVSNDGSFSIEIASTGQVLAVPANKTVAQVLESHGIDIPLSCEQGVCGTCLTRVLKGIPDHRDLFLTEDEQALNDQFTPCCSRSKTPLLVLDI